jgi:flagellar biosynthesis GTPase FlhF
MQQVQSTSPSAISGSSLYLAAPADYLDFSLPSYSDNQATSKPKVEAPSFSNPFENFDFTAPKSDTSSSDDSTTAEETAAKEQAKAIAEDKAAKQKEAAADEKSTKEAAKKAKEEEKAAKDAAKKQAEEEGAAKKAEKEARRQAELEKQKAAVQRASSIVPVSFIIHSVTESITISVTNSSHFLPGHCTRDAQVGSTGTRLQGARYQGSRL